jgi:hypothetical protein
VQHISDRYRDVMEWNAIWRSWWEEFALDRKGAQSDSKCFPIQSLDVRGKCGKVGVSFVNSVTCHNISRCSDLQQFRCAMEFFKLLDFYYIFRYVSVIQRVISRKIPYL